VFRLKMARARPWLWEPRPLLASWPTTLSPVPTMRHIATPNLSPVHLAIAALLINVAAVSTSQAQADATLPSITVNAPKLREGKTSIGGFGNTPEWQQPQQAERFSDEALKNAQVQRLSDVVSLDASVSSYYNAAGYWDYLSVRGFVLDLTHNYRREGLPISGETSLALDNKAAVEVFKGTSGMQAGVSAPGGLMNLVVKRPEGHIRNAEVAFGSHGSVLTSLDVSERLGQSQDFGVRINAAHAHLNSSIQNTQGQRDLLALAGDWRAAPGTLVEAEIEYSRRNQHSQPGFSMLGEQLPLASSIDPNINLNNQPWAQPVVMQGTTGTLRVTHKLSSDWKATGTFGEQRLITNDRTAFPFGGLCTSGDGYSNCDRYAANGDFEVYDYRSNHESRVTRSLDANVAGAATTGPIKHELTIGTMRTLARVSLSTAAYTPVGSGNISGDFSVPEGPVYDSALTLRGERTTELYVRDSMQLSEAWRAWGGVRRTQLSRTQTLTDFSMDPSRTSQSFTTPWLALGYEFAPKHQVYASWGEGVEVLPAPFTSPSGKPIVNAGEVLPAQKSRQWEIGVKGQDGQTNWSVDYFHVVRPEAASVDQGDGNLTYQADGDSRHQGIEGQLHTRIQNYGLDLSAMVLDARRRHSATDSINGKAPTNVPDYAIKMGHSYRVSALPGLTLTGDIVHEGPRTADAANDVRIPAWTRLDASASLAQNWGQHDVTWRLGITNLLDTRAWVESPTQFDHIYLFPMSERAFNASMQISF
jgi:iron complex outermembrane receptor protein